MWGLLSLRHLGRWVPSPFRPDLRGSAGDVDRGQRQQLYQEMGGEKRKENRIFPRLEEEWFYKPVPRPFQRHSKIIAKDLVRSLGSSVTDGGKKTLCCEY